MRAKLDENLPVEAAELLRTAGWECDSVYDEGLAGADDPEVAAACQAGARVLFTLDLDRHHPPGTRGRRAPRCRGIVNGMDIHRTAARALALTAAIALSASTVRAQDMPAEYQAVLTALGKKGDFKDGVLKVNIPRADLTVKIGTRPAPTPFGFGGWVAMTAGEGMQVMMGDLVLTEDEVNPVMSALLDHQLEVTALHNHFFWDQPRIFYLHVHGMGSAADLAQRLKPAIALIDAATARSTAPAGNAPPAGVTGAAVAKIIGQQGEQSGPVYKITIGRPDIDVREHGARINARMGLNTWAAFAGTDADAMVAGDVAMRESELQPVLKALRSHGINVVAIHHHMTGVTPMVVFLHYYGTGTAATLAQGVRAAVDLLGTARAAAQ